MYKLMGKITKAESKLHDEALAVLSLIRKLKEDEKEFVYNNFNPMATNNVGKGAIFFTPLELAWEFAINSNSDGAVLDLAAGIGALSFTHRCTSNNKKRHVAIELNPEFVEIGKKLLPEVEWICGSIFDLELLRDIGSDFTLTISNPPYGNIPSKIETEWMTLKGPAELLAIEIALRMAYSGGITIIPKMYADYRNGEYPEPTNNVKKLRNAFGDIHLQPWESGVYDNVKWQGVNPNVIIIDINNDDVEWERPYKLPLKQMVF